MVLAAPRPEPVGEAEEVRLVDGVQHLHHRPLDDLVLQRGDAERPLPAVGLGDVLPPRRLRPVGTPLYASVQVSEVALETRLVLVPGDAVDAGAARRFNWWNAQRSRSTVTWCRSAVNRTRLSRLAVSRMRSSAWDTLSQLWVWRVLPRTALPLAPPLPSIASAAASSALFGDFTGTMGESDFPWPCIIGLRVRLADADRPGGRSRAASQWISRFPCRWLPRVREVSDHAGPGWRSP